MHKPAAKIGTLCSLFFSKIPGDGQISNISNTEFICS
jgi:hypothetical protein